MTLRVLAVLVVVTLVCLDASVVVAKRPTQHHHKYKEKDAVEVLVNNIGPYSNPSETYPYYSLPFCQPLEKKVQHRHKSLGEALEGDTISQSLYDIRFKVPVAWTPLCKAHLMSDQIQAFKDAIRKYYYFEFFLDDLPVRGFIGTTDRDASEAGEPRYFLFKHLNFNILYNGNRIIYGNVTADVHQVVELKDDSDIMVEFSYSVEWSKTNVPYKRRFDYYKDTFFEQELEIHWLSIMNSFVLVTLLTGFVALIIMRVLKRDYARYAKQDDDQEDPDASEDYGWKLVHGDVFRLPQYTSLFSSFVGIGFQFLTMTFSLLILALVGAFHPGDAGSLYTAALVLYALTSSLGGFVSSNVYRKMRGRKWAWNVILTSCLYAIPFFVVAAVVNVIAMRWGVTTKLSIGTIVVVLLIWLLVGFPLCVGGSIAGRRTATDFVPPVRVANFKREIPDIPWYRSGPFQLVMAGFLPFSAIYIELYYLFSSVWGRNTYQLFGVLFIVFVILIIVTSCITIALTYFQLTMEDHRWWWWSFFNGGSTGIFIYVYSIFYWYYRSQMSGSLQAAFFFGYMGVVCYFFFIMLGTVGFVSSWLFVRTIYANIKID